jgi:hypothetical protein
MLPKLRRAGRILHEEGPLALIRRAGSFAGTRMRRLPARVKAYRVRHRKAAMDEAERRYNHDPRVSFLLQSFNQRGNVSTIAPRIPDGSEHERIICEDGSSDGSLAAWDERMTRRNDFVVRSNDLHEIRAYTRAVGLSRGEYVCLLQDDDEPPADPSWIEATVDLFERYPDLGVVCGQSGWGLQDLVPDYRFDPPAEGGHEVTDRWLREGGGVKDETPGEVPTVDPGTGRPFVFVPCISVGPVVFRRTVFDALGGFDLDFSDPGQSGMGFEVDFGLRCWRAGYEVAFTPMGFDRGDVGGTLLFDPEGRERAHERAWERLRAKHRDSFDLVSERVHAANARLDAR